MAEYKFVKELPDDYLCMICAKVLNEPHVTDCCGQHFCQVCLEQWFKKQAKKICPHCRSESFNHMRYLPLKRKIDDLEVYCPNQKEGCKVITKLGELDSHKNGCGYAKVECSQGCGQSILRKDLMHHCSIECAKRKTKCKYCGTVDHYETINGEHMTICEEYPMNCPRGCTQCGGIKRKELAEHAEICPLEKVQCPFNEAGCDARVLRKDLDAHMESSTQQHLMVMMTAYGKLKSEHIKLNSEHSKLKDDFKQLSSKMAGLTLAEPVKLTELEMTDSFSFTITSTEGWISPPFCILDTCTLYIKHKEGGAASLMLQKVNSDISKNMLRFYVLEIRLWMQQRMPIHARGVMARQAQAGQLLLKFDLSNIRSCHNIDCGKEVTNFTLPDEDSILNSKVAVTIIYIM